MGRARKVKELEPKIKGLGLPKREHLSGHLIKIRTLFEDATENVRIRVKDLKENTAYFKCVLQDPHNLPTICKNCPYKRKPKKIVLEIEVDDHYFKTWHPDDWIRHFCVRIYDKLNEIIASYCPRYNILWASDWFYDSITTKNAVRVLEKLRDKGIIQKSKNKLPFERKEEIRVEVWLGADIELEIFDDEAREPLRACYYYEGTGPIGCDGTGDQLELRPAPAQDPAEVIQNIRDLLSKVSINKTIRAYSEEYPLGAHIHLSIKVNSKEVDLQEPPKSLIEMLDDFLGKPMAMVNKILYRKRIDEGYGRLGDYRSAEKHWGFEYRTPPTFWLYDPYFAYITLKIAKNVLHYYVLKAIKGEKIRYKVPLTFKEYREIARLTKKEFEYWKSVIRKAVERDPEIVERLKSDIRGNWNINEIVVTPIFSDDWDRSIKQLFENTLQFKVPLKYANKFKIVIYGLAERRGKYLVSHEFDSQPPEPYTSYEHVSEYRERMGLSKNTIVIGLSYETRMGLTENPEHIKRLLDWLKENIEKRVKEILKELEGDR